MSENPQDHYLKAVTELGDTKSLVASQNINSANGTILIAAGYRINSKIYKKLVSHKLKPSLDNCISSEDILNVADILADLHEILNKNQKLFLMAEAINNKFSIDQILLSLVLPSPLLFRITVSKEKFVTIYHRALTCMIITLFLGVKDQQKTSSIENLALAALFHNTGMLHVDPKLLDPGYVMNSTERRHLYAHPLTAYLFLREFNDFPIEAAKAVLEHHERMDGRGYPKSMKGINIGRKGQILGLAVVSAKSFELYERPGKLKALETRLKINVKQYGSNLIDHLLNFIHKSTKDILNEKNEKEDLEIEIASISQIIGIFNSIDPKNKSEIAKFVLDRFASLRNDFLSTGIDLSNFTGLLENVVSDPYFIEEFMPMINEAKWQINAIIRDIFRIWNNEVEDTYKSNSADLAWLTEINLLTRQPEVESEFNLT